MTSDEVVAVMLRINGQGSTLAERLNMRRVLDYVSSVAGSVKVDQCSHLPPAYAGRRHGQDVRCQCGKVAYRWRWTGPSTGYMWDVV